MLHPPRLRGAATSQAVAIGLGTLFVLLGACSQFDRSPDPAIGSDPVTVRSREPNGAENPLTSFLRQRLSNDPRGALAVAPGAVGWDDGYIADSDSLSPFESDHPAIVNLDPALLEAIRVAALDARHDGIELRISSGWRSAAYQEALLDEAIRSYGSEEEARQFVNTPERSTHVTGKAVDVAPTDAMSWLSQHGSAYGLCQTYSNELWHYELMIEPGGMCPSPFSDASVMH